MTKELELWKSEFGDDYRKRNTLTEETLAQREQMWLSILGSAQPHLVNQNQAESVFELGAGQGTNLIAIKSLIDKYREKATPTPDFYALEPNANTRKILKFNSDNYKLKLKMVKGDANKIDLPNSAVDLSFTSGVLIHIHPDNLLGAMKEIYRVTKRIIICAEYFSVEPREVIYHGEKALWTRDFGSMWLENFGVRCAGYSFFWKKLTKIDNLMVWVFEKVN